MNDKNDTANFVGECDRKNQCNV